MPVLIHAWTAVELAKSLPITKGRVCGYVTKRTGQLITDYFKESGRDDDLYRRLQSISISMDGEIYGYLSDSLGKRLELFLLKETGQTKETLFPEIWEYTKKFRLNSKFCWAIQQGNWKELIDTVSEVNISDPMGVTPLCRAVSAVDYELIKLLIKEKGALVDFRGENKMCPLDYSLCTKKKKLVKLLLNFGADPCDDYWGQVTSPLESALMDSNDFICSILLQYSTKNTTELVRDYNREYLLEETDSETDSL